ncbi:MAG: energy transducer TonB [Chthoniobacterales bacterium]
MAFVRRIVLFAALIGLGLVGADRASAGEKGGSKQPQKKTVPKTALAAYQKQITDLIASRWYALTKAKLDTIAVGRVRLRFRILENGSVTNLKILSNTSNETFSQICVQAVMESKFPSIPASVRQELGLDYLDWENMDFTMYPN